MSQTASRPARRSVTADWWPVAARLLAAAIGLVVFVALRLRLHRWPEPLFLAVTVMLKPRVRS